MSDGVMIEGKRIIYGQARPLLPIFLPEGELKWILWGERREADFYPHGGWVHPTDLKGKSWRPLQPREVIIPADGFMVHKQGGAEAWFSLAEGESLRGMIACSDQECRVYVMTTQAPPQFSWARRWPDIAKRVPERSPFTDRKSSRGESALPSA